MSELTQDIMKYIDSCDSPEAWVLIEWHKKAAILESKNMSHRKSSKKKCKRFALKRALKWVSNTTHDSMSAARRRWGLGASK